MDDKRVVARSGKVLKKWVSRFDVYPFLEQFTLDAAAEINSQVRARLRDRNLVPVVSPPASNW